MTDSIFSKEYGLSDCLPSLETLKENCNNCKKCKLHLTKGKTVFGSGSSSSDICIIAEAPGEDEQKKGEPFVGKAGKKLDSILNYYKLDRNKFYITNIIKCRPPANREPGTLEKKMCEDYLVHQLRIVNPKLIICLGNHSAKSITGKEGIDHLHGQIIQSLDKFNFIDCVITYHPASLFYGTKEQREYRSINMKNDFDRILDYINLNKLDVFK